MTQYESSCSRAAGMFVCLQKQTCTNKFDFLHCRDPRERNQILVTKSSHANASRVAQTANRPHVLYNEEGAGWKRGVQYS